MTTNAHELFIGGVGPAHFRRALARIPSSVVIAGALVRGAPVGLALGSFAAVSLNPPTVGFFCDRRSRDLVDLLGAVAWSFTLLLDDDLATLDAFRRPEGPGHGAVPWRVSAQGTPHLDAAALTIDAVPCEAVPAGDHTAVLGRVIAVRVGDPAARPLVLQGGRLARLEPGRLVDREMTQRG